MGSTLRARPVLKKIDLTKRFEEFAYSRFQDGRLLPVIDRIFNWSEANEAHQYMEENRNIGKIVLVVD
jgi:tumor protein p53-inducible protein 3